jgi:cob(I)alamin adenosyltransferase
MRLTKIYTRQGDKGNTVFKNKKLPKDDIAIEVIGTLDELNSAIGLTLSFNPTDESGLNSLLFKIQNHLFDLGGELHSPQASVINAEHILFLENKLDELNATLPPLAEFILPGGPPHAASCHLARTICRRTERLLVTLNRQDPLTNSEMLRYLNRLSDLLFVIARIYTQKAKSTERLWEHSHE